MPLLAARFILQSIYALQMDFFCCGRHSISVSYDSKLFYPNYPKEDVT